MNANTSPNKVWYTRCQVPTASGIALDLGWLSERLSAFNTELGILQDAPLEIALSHYDHSLPTLIREGGSVPAIVARAEGVPTRLLGLTFIDEGQAIVAHPERLREKQDLRGARIAIPAFAARRNASHARAMALGGFEAALRHVGLTFGDVSIIETPLALTVPPGRLRRDLKIKDWPSLEQVASGEADAAYVKGAAAREAAHRLGLTTLVDIDALPIRDRVNNGTPRPITVHADLLEKRPELVIAFVSATLRAGAWVGENHDRVISIVCKETGATRDFAEATYGSNLQAAMIPSLDYDRLDLLDIQIDRLARHGFIDSKVNIDDWIAPEILKAGAAALKEDVSLLQ
ncbi:ABC transporter substrate-binding protein [Shinella sp.]|uniref:ABC transporter substrate-binding protein n=1 Tax=Shinella sp. TaxID=1870904 RepID=UPI003F6F4B4C